MDNVNNELVARALSYATIAHANQMCGDAPFIDHMEKVVKLMQVYGVKDPEILAAGYLYNVLSVRTQEDVRQNFGKRVTGMVSACTELKGRRKPLARYEGMRANSDAVTLAVADRIVLALDAVLKEDIYTLHTYRRDAGFFESRLYSAIRQDDVATQLLAKTLSQHVTNTWHAIHAAVSIHAEQSSRWYRRQVTTICKSSPRAMWSGKYTTKPMEVSCSHCLAKCHIKKFNKWKQQAALVALTEVEG
jgi:hypothetical protein